MAKDPVFNLERRDAPLLISMPHLGTGIPETLKSRYALPALQLADTDWHLDRLYAFAAGLDATIISARISRYVIDLNRPTGGGSLYPGVITASLCPTETFRGEPLYREGHAPDPAEVDRRVAAYWLPYHQALRTELARLRVRHSHVLLWDAHSIASVLPRLFVGKLPDFSFGTSEGSSCDDRLAAAAIQPLRKSGNSWVLNGRFTGGFITRRYGVPRDGVHAIQLEMCQSLYMDERAPFDWIEEKSHQVMPLVRSSVEAALTALRGLR